MKAAIQVLRQAEELKKRVSGDVLNDNDAWSSHQQLQDLYQQLLVSDLEFALDKKVEQDLWNYVFKNQINALQNQTKDKKNPRLTESQDNLTWFLGAASGFYLELLQELCEAFDLDLSCRRKGSVYGITRGTRAVRSNITRPHQHSCLYICQHCLVHLGDIARYRNQSRQAETFYHHAAQLVPTNGQPYNQLAILEAAKGDKLSTVFYYVRSIAVKFPFPVASTNLQKMFSKIAIEGNNFEGKNKLSVYDYISAFLQFHALAHLTSNLTAAESLVKPLSANIMTLVATEGLTGWRLAQMVAINLFALTRALRGLEGDTEQETLTEEEQSVYTLILELMSSMLNGLLLLVYTMKDESALVGYYALPVINLIFGWLRLDPAHLKTAAFTSKLQIWPSLCKLLNGIVRIPTDDWNEYKHTDVPLPEDWDLQGFLPLSGVHSAYKFKETSRHLTDDEETKLRITRLVGHGKWLCEQEIYGVKLMTMTAAKDGGGFHFEAVTQQTPSVDLLMQLEEMSISSKQDSKMTNSNNSHAEDEEPTRMVTVEGPVSGTSPQPVAEDKSKKHVGRGIIGNTRSDKKTRQNVAMQTIVQRKNMQDGLNEDKSPVLKPRSEGKQVTFKTPSPSPPASSGSTPPLPTVVQQQHAPYPTVAVASWANGMPANQTPPSMYPLYYQNFPAQKQYYQQQNPPLQDGPMALGNQTNVPNFPALGNMREPPPPRFGFMDQENVGPMSYSKAVIQGNRSMSPALYPPPPPQMIEQPPTNFNMMVPPLKDRAGPPLPPPPPPPTVNLLAMQQQQQQMTMQFGFPSPQMVKQVPGGLWRPQWPSQVSPPSQVPPWFHQFPPPNMKPEQSVPPTHENPQVPSMEPGRPQVTFAGPPPDSGHAQYMYHLVNQVPQQQQQNQMRSYHGPIMVPQHAIWGGAVQGTPQLGEKLGHQHVASGGNRTREEYKRAGGVSPTNLEVDTTAKTSADVVESNTYSLFSSSWSSGLNLGGTSAYKEKDDESGSSNVLQFGGLLQQGLQSLWSSAGPTPLEQLLEQQKRKREPVTK